MKEKQERRAGREEERKGNGKNKSGREKEGDERKAKRTKRIKGKVTARQKPKGVVKEDR